MGSGALGTLNEILQLKDPRRPLLVTGPTIRKIGLVDRALAAMGEYGSRTEVFINPRPEPDVHVVRECGRAARDCGADLIIGLGGGSPLDVAKGGAVAAVYDGDIRRLLGRNLLERPGLPTVLIPTTSGSGTETTQAAVMGDPQERTKKSILDPRLMAWAAVIDPDLTLDMPPRLTAETGLDALVHALEGYTTRDNNPMADMYCLEALRLIGRSLVAAYENGRNLEARAGMSRAATLAGLGMTNSGLGGIHALALGLDSTDGFTHCHSLAVLAPWVIHFNLDAAPQRYAAAAEALGEDVAGCSAEQAAACLVDAILRLFERLNLSPCLRDYNVIEKDVGDLAERAFIAGQRLIHMNIKPITAPDAQRIFERAYKGQ